MEVIYINDILYIYLTDLKTMRQMKQEGHEAPNRLLENVLFKNFNNLSRARVIWSFNNIFLQFGLVTQFLTQYDPIFKLGLDIIKRNILTNAEAKIAASTVLTRFSSNLAY